MAIRESLDRGTSWAARVIAIGGFLVAVGGWATGWFNATVTEMVDQRLASQRDTEVRLREKIQHDTEIRLWKEIQRDVLLRVAGNRYVMTGTCSGIHSNGEPFVALNEAFLAFADEPEVLEALEDLWESDSRDAERVVALIKRMATAADIRISVDDAFLSRPFTPNAPDVC